MGKRTETVILGDSHVQAIKRACKLRGSTGSKVNFSAYRLSKMKSGVKIGDLDMADAIRVASGLDSTDMLVCAIGGQQHSVFGLIQHDVPFDILEPEDKTGSVTANAGYIPYTSVWDFFETWISRWDGERLATLRRSTKSAVYQVTPPPPKADEAHILRRHETDFANADIQKKGVSPAPLRLKVWKLHVRVLTHLCASWDIKVIPVPLETQTPDGFLKPEYYADDATHANAAYGELVLKQLEAIATQGLSGVQGVRASV